ncbi:CRISPR-associated endonuclease Cas2 [Candidatus Giovannonibacteria bacterium]|nr:CRISPR-associated endonuclease Cas2 [Candidatus Giovannonibacteria bacterium]
MRNFGSLGTTSQKILLLLLAGASLTLAYSPKKKLRVLKDLPKEWEKINRRILYNCIRNLYENRLLDIKNNKDGTVTIILTSNGKNKALTYDLENIRIKKMENWDKKWRIILFDIPEKHKKARDAIAKLLKNMGCYKFQKSVFVHPFECRDEVDFVIEFFSLRPYVRYIVADTIDNELHLKQYFDLL